MANSACAYCGTQTRPTGEHVFPKWLCDETADLVQTVRQNGSLGWDPNTVVIKDVCSRCNTGVLSQLDAFAKSVWEEPLSRIVQADDGPIDYEIDVQKFFRWLLKVSYNMARAKGASSDVAALADTVPLMLGEDSCLRTTALYHGTLVPVTRAAKRYEPRGVRIAIAGGGGPFATMRLVGLRSHLFLVAISTRPDPDIDDWEFPPFIPALGLQFDRIDLSGRCLPVRPSGVDVLRFEEIMTENDREAYQRALVREDSRARRGK